jgi:hypothetical protein
MVTSGRNERCLCGSGRKYKRCCGVRAAAPSGKAKALLGILPLAAAIGLAAAVQDRQASDLPARVWSPEHGHWHEAAGGGRAGSVPVPAPQPPGPATPGKVWSAEHGHWHDIP